MSKKAKQLVTRHYTAWYEGVDSLCVADLTGLDAISTHRLRGELHKKGIQAHIVKNSLARRAFEGGPLEPLGKALTGPCALFSGGASVIDIAKELVHLAAEMQAIKLKFGIIEGDPALMPVTEMAKMKSRAELQGEVVMLMLSPWRRVCGQVTSPWAKVAGSVKAIAEKEPADQAQAA
jgi:large subunit ribosomal protein L10